MTCNRSDPHATFARPSSIRSVGSNTSLNQSAYSSISATEKELSGTARFVDQSKYPYSQFTAHSDPNAWSAHLFSNQPENDDFLHNPDPRRDHKWDRGGSMFTGRGIANLGCLFIMAAGLITLFAGYPLATYFSKHDLKFFGGFNVGGTNATGQVPSMAGNWGLIDLDTPQEAYTKPSFRDGSDWALVFSDEFNEDGRSFFPGDDPYWEAVDLHYWQTGDMEWYHPDAITTKDGALHVTIAPKEIKGMDYMGGMMSTWNKFCFTGGLFEASVSLPGVNNIIGLWPAVWAMGNLGRAGYGASLEGMWPYSYDACDVGTVANQSINGVPEAISTVDPNNPGPLSFLPGQKLSRCSCPGEPHPGPVHSDGTFVGRSAPEIDMFEAQISALVPDGPLLGQVSQSGQWGPFNHNYIARNSSDVFKIADPTITQQNSYNGGIYQQASSAVTQTNQECYEGTGDCFAVYGFEYKPGFDGAYITWITNDVEAYTIEAAAMGADPITQISDRPVPQEPMYLIINLGMSTSFTGFVDTEHIPFPATMKVDYVRVYQPKDSINVGCDPEDFPTQAYINQYMEAYTNPNLTTWRDDFKQPFPKNSLIDQC
ncbi:glycoside hydrolase family 16 protein [Heliocybe sulcata]|uniref:Glycoside hydrolase family 16 protein n=1 Tax=Heliocybe sulcata TaxID=5364 RepID=A0A5C3MT75_9AGAM|nr:glycoside hydrolase family 16 protein [Heliocybe sulcata]